MTSRKPRKPWRVRITGAAVTATSDLGSELAAYDLAHAALRGESPADRARIEHWEDGAWRLYERLTPADVPTA